MLIGNRKLKSIVINQLIRDIKKKKELAYLADEFVEESLKRYLKKDAKAVNFLIDNFSEKAKGYKSIIKGVRKELRKVYGLYKIQQEITGRKKYFEELVKTKPGSEKFLKLHKAILETHSSSKERLNFYEGLYSDLFKITGKPKIIVDLGCGLNPFSIPFMKLKKLTYYAYDIGFDDINLVGKYFEFLNSVDKKLSGEAGILDLLAWDKIKNLKKADICFLWKLTDVLDRQKGHKVSEMVIVQVPAKYVVVSFPTLTVSGKPMNKPRRKWIELMCKRLKYEYRVIKKENEIFYVIKK